MTILLVQEKLMIAKQQLAVRVSLTAVIAMTAAFALGLSVLETSLAVGLSVLGAWAVRKVFHL